MLFKFSKAADGRSASIGPDRHLSLVWLRLPARFTCPHASPARLQVELIYYVFGRSKFPGATTANLQRFVRRFNEVQYWVATEVCLCEDLMKRAALLKKFVKIASV